jgi:PTH1 family peptidyl-tRNA hydrolase
VLVVLGLGNPGAEYDGTRHNVGKEVVGSLTAGLRLRALPGRGEFTWARDPSRDLVLVVPTTYVNTTGRAVRQALEQFGARTGDLLIVCDDFALPLGSVRLRKRGSDGGHNGLASVIYEIQSGDFARLRVGTGPLPPGADSSEFVLSPFGPGEREVVAEAVALARQAVMAVLQGGMDRAMNTYNVKPTAPDEPCGEPD